MDEGHVRAVSGVLRFGDVGVPAPRPGARGHALPAVAGGGRVDARRDRAAVPGVPGRGGRGGRRRPRARRGRRARGVGPPPPRVHPRAGPAVDRARGPALRGRGGRGRPAGLRPARPARHRRRRGDPDRGAPDGLRSRLPPRGAPGPRHGQGPLNRVDVAVLTRGADVRRGRTSGPRGATRRPDA
ncbi:hypothetical protein MICRO80W_880006 [Micrococcus luteus]|nr:hypothetical protein MICRO80W_880006 [Micrococcus luteus]